jgi:hypothetical protein
MGLKNYPNRPFWMANPPFYGLEYGSDEQTTVFVVSLVFRIGSF